MRGEEGGRILHQKGLFGRLMVAIALLALAACLTWRLGLAAKEGCQTCHTDRAALRASLSPLPERSVEEEEES
ncbi:MAG: hypothetical protein QHH30_00590 [candidate division NC10 bacterium]|nr:hypothetical protein [candidate division NC10 bacterium]